MRGGDPNDIAGFAHEVDVGPVVEVAGGVGVAEGDEVVVGVWGLLGIECMETSRLCGDELLKEGCIGQQNHAAVWVRIGLDDFDFVFGLI